MKCILVNLTLVWLVAFCVFSTPGLAQDKHVALVIGNSEYTHVSALPNSSNDAEDIGRALKRLRFEVTELHDLDYTTMRLSLRDFSEKAAAADIALIYFAGHGIEIDKTNYLVPVNAELKRDRDVEFESIRLDAVIGSLDGTKGVRIVLLDACRNNPFVADMVRTTATRSIGRGLSRIDPGGVLVGYAARGGTIALDGQGRNSPYAKALLAHIEEPGVELGKLFRRVRDAVLEQTDGFQEPFTYGSLPGDDIYLVPPIEVAALSKDKAQPTVFEQMLTDFADSEKYGTLKRWSNFVQTYGANTENELVRIALARKAELEKERDKRTRSANRPPLLEPEFDGKGHAILDREQRRLIQQALAYMGHYSGPIDGAIGPRTREAVSAARFRAGLVPGTQIDRALLRLLPDVAATDALKSSIAKFHDPDDLPVGLEARLDKALRAFFAPPRKRVMFDYYDGHLYLAVYESNNSDTFETASRKAAKAGGHLVTIQSAAENKFLYEFFSKDPKFIRKDTRGTLYGPMIGLFQPTGSSEPRGGWTWITGEPLVYTAWAPGNPDNHQKRQNRARFFLNGNLVRPGSVPRFWDDTSNGMWGLGYIVEIE